jgi:pimeloyl-ACP methyl ester carboxylesterase
MNLQVMEALGVDKAFVLGTSQGGWVTVRMALLAPEKVYTYILSAFPQCVCVCAANGNRRSSASSHSGHQWTTNLTAAVRWAAGLRWTRSGRRSRRGVRVILCQTLRLVMRLWILSSMSRGNEGVLEEGGCEELRGGRGEEEDHHGFD